MDRGRPIGVHRDDLRLTCLRGRDDVRTRWSDEPEMNAACPLCCATNVCPRVRATVKGIRLYSAVVMDRPMQGLACPVSTPRSRGAVVVDGEELPPQPAHAKDTRSDPVPRALCARTPTSRFVAEATSASSAHDVGEASRECRSVSVPSWLPSLPSLPGVHGASVIVASTRCRRAA